MALVLTIGIFAVPAMAAQDDDGIEPYGQYVRCPSCNAAIATSSFTTWAENGTVYIGCYKDAAPHAHFRS